MSESQANLDLQTINKRRLFGEDVSQDLPQITLSDGTKLQTGTIGALLQNIKLYDRILAGEVIEGLTREDLEHMLVVPIPTLQKVGMFDIFPPEDWISDTSAGRKFVGEAAKQRGV